jgi:hypothetical protein
LAARIAEAPQERRLADPRLAADQQHVPTRAARDRLQGIDEHRQLGGPLEQRARRTCVGT